MLPGKLRYFLNGYSLVKSPRGLGIFFLSFLNLLSIHTLVLHGVWWSFVFTKRSRMNISVTNDGTFPFQTVTFSLTLFMFLFLFFFLRLSFPYVCISWCGYIARIRNSNENRLLSCIVCHRERHKLAKGDNMRVFMLGKFDNATVWVRFRYFLTVQSFRNTRSACSILFFSIPFAFFLCHHFSRSDVLYFTRLTVLWVLSVCACVCVQQYVRCSLSQHLFFFFFCSHAMVTSNDELNHQK